MLRRQLIAGFGGRRVGVCKLASWMMLLAAIVGYVLLELNNAPGRSKSCVQPKPLRAIARAEATTSAASASAAATDQQAALLINQLLSTNESDFSTNNNNVVDDEINIGVTVNSEDQDTLCFFAPQRHYSTLWEYRYVTTELLSFVQVPIRAYHVEPNWGRDKKIDQWAPATFVVANDGHGDGNERSNCSYCLRFNNAFYQSSSSISELMQVCPHAKRYGLIQVSGEFNGDEGPSTEQFDDARLVLFFKQYYLPGQRYTKYPRIFAHLPNIHTNDFWFPPSALSTIVRSTNRHTFCIFYGRMKPIRVTIAEALRAASAELGYELCHFKESEQLSPQETSIRMQHAVITLAPPGMSPNTFRFTESLLVGSLPILWNVDEIGEFYDVAKHGGWLAAYGLAAPFLVVNDTSRQLIPLLIRLRQLWLTKDKLLNQMQHEQVCYLANYMADLQSRVAVAFAPAAADTALLRARLRLLRASRLGLGYCSDKTIIGY